MSNGNVYGGQFCSPEERQICTIGTGYIANYISGSGAKQAGATLTNKRVYFSGTVYARNSSGRFSIFSRRQIVNTRDITGTGYDFYRPIQWLLWAFMFIAFSPIAIFAIKSEDISMAVTVGLLVLSLVCFILYFALRQTLLFIEYAGGNIAFSVKMIQKHEQDDFIRNIHLAKDYLYGNSAVEQGFVNDGDFAPSDNEIPEL